MTFINFFCFSGDLETATDTFCKKVLETNCISAWPTFVTKLIEVEKIDLLQKVTNVITEIESEAYSIFVLLSQFAKLKKTKEIEKLLGKMIPIWTLIVFSLLINDSYSF